MAALTPVIRTSSSSPGFLETLPEEIRPRIFQFCGWEDFISLFRTSVNSRVSTAKDFAELCFTFQQLHPTEIVKIHRILSPLGISPSFSATRLEICQLANLRPPYRERTFQEVHGEFTSALKMLEITRNRTIKQITMNSAFFGLAHLSRLFECTPQLEAVAIHNSLLLGPRSIARLSRFPLRTLTFNGGLHLGNPPAQLNRQLLHRDIICCPNSEELVQQQIQNNEVYTRRVPFLFSLTDFTSYGTLETLNFRSVNDLTDIIATQIRTSLIHLKNLTLINCQTLSAEGTKSFLDHPHLTEVTLLDQSVDDAALETLTSKAKGLQKVEIRAIKLSLSKPTDRGIRSFLDCKNLIDLQISLGGVSQISIEALQELARKWFSTPNARNLVFRNRDFCGNSFQKQLELWRC